MVYVSNVSVAQTVNYTVRHSALIGSSEEYANFNGVVVEVTAYFANDNTDFARRKEALSSILEDFSGATVLQASDPSLPFMLSPKNGMSIQEAISWIKDQWRVVSYVVLGVEVPSLTANNVKMVVTQHNPTMERIAEYIYTGLSQVTGFLGVRAENTAAKTRVTLLNQSVNPDQLALL